MRTSLSRTPLWQLTTRRSHVCFATATKAASRRRRKQTTSIPADSTADADPISSTKQSLAKTPDDATITFGDAPSNPKFDSTNQWVVFSDLHVSAKTIDTSLEVLRYVHQQAQDRSAGVLFLGDFWDRRGDLPVTPLNRIQNEITSWSVPLLLLPGNHDQVDLGGLDHSLEPIKVAAQLAHVFTTPTIFRESLWLPYRRRESEVKEAVDIALKQQPIKAIFGHADVLTAHMNASYQAKDGLPPDLFPASVPVYLGHYHYPHTVQGTSITYIGSPYQVSRSEAGQQKRLLLLDHNWQIASEIPLNIGRRFWNFHSQPLALPDSSNGSSSSSSGDESSSVTDLDGMLDPAVVAAATAVGEVMGSNPAAGARCLLQPEFIRAMLEQGNLRRGDVAHFRYEEDSEQLSSIQKMLAEKGVQVELHHHPRSRPVARIAAAEQLSMQQLLEQYAATTAMHEEVLQHARQALKELGSRSSETPHHSHLQLHSVTVEGFGPFQQSVHYPLAGRGVVAVTGRNEDDTAAVSNGAGKTSLLTSLLWAFKVGDGRDMVTADYVNENSRRATVTVRGSINQECFELIRSITRTQGSLSLTVAGQELTGQEQRLTEITLKNMFSTALLPKTLVFTQEDLLGLLQSNDAAFKGVLSTVVDTTSWDEAKQIAQEHKSDLERQLSKLSILAQQCQQNIGRAEADLERQQQQQLAWEQQQQQRQVQATQAKQLSLQTVYCTAQDIQALQQQLAAALAAAAAQQQLLQTEAAAARTAAAAAAQQLEQQQQEERATVSSSSSSSSSVAQELVPVVQPEFDEAAAAAARQPLQQQVAHAQNALSQQQAVTNELHGQLKAAQQRRLKYQKLQGHVHSDVITHNNNVIMRNNINSSSSGADIEASSSSSAAAAAAHGLRPVCEQCLQPINSQLYQQNLDNMAAGEQKLQQELDRSTCVQQQLEQSLAAAHRAYEDLSQQQAEERDRVQVERERLRSAEAAAARVAQREAQQALQQQRQQHRQQQWQQQQLFEAANKLQRELSRLQQLTTSFKSLSTQLAQNITYISQKLQLPDLLSSSSSTAASPLTSPAAATIDLFGSEPVLRKETARLIGNLAAAGDAVVQAGAMLDQLAAAQNPYVSGVQQAQRSLEEQQQRLQESEQQQGELNKQLILWKRVYVAFGRTGIPSFLTEGVLTELQAACSRHLSQLAAGMSLELSATSVKKTAAKKPPAKKPSAANAAMKKSAKAAAAVAAAWDEFDLPSAPASSMSTSNLATSDLDLVTSSDLETAADTVASTDSADLDADVAAADLKEEISKVVRVRSSGGELRQRSIAQLSGGEKKRVALALGLGFAELVAARSRLTSNVLILDEVLEKLDDEGCICVAQLLKTLPYSSVFVVGQAGSFVTKEFAAVDTVVKSGGQATVELGGARS